MACRTRKIHPWVKPMDLNSHVQPAAISTIRYASLVGPSIRKQSIHAMCTAEKAIFISTGNCHPSFPVETMTIHFAPPIKPFSGVFWFWHPDLTSMKPCKYWRILHINCLAGFLPSTILLIYQVPSTLVPARLSCSRSSGWTITVLLSGWKPKNATSPPKK